MNNFSGAQTSALLQLDKSGLDCQLHVIPIFGLLRLLESFPCIFAANSRKSSRCANAMERSLIVEVSLNVFLFFHRRFRFRMIGFVLFQSLIRCEQLSAIELPRRW